MDEPERLAYLKKLPLFSALDDREFRALSMVFRSRDLASGERLFRERDLGTACYILATGALEVSITRGGQAHKLAMITSGQLVGHVAMIDRGPRSATLTALQPCTVLELGRSDFDRLVGEASSLAFKFQEVLAKLLTGQLRGATRDLTHLASREGTAIKPKPVAHPDIQDELRLVAMGMHGASMEDLEMLDSIEIVHSEADRYRDYKRR